MTLTETIKSITTSKDLALTIADSADDRKAGDILVLGVENISYLTDYFVIATGFSRTQVRAIADSIEERVERECGILPLRVEGKTDASWVVIDYNDIIVHIFLPEERTFYNLEAFWGHAEKVEFISS
jgi:ribosome-associated protein